MRIEHAVSLAVSGLVVKPSRTFLTLLGIAIGVMAVTVIASLGAGTERLITDEISGLGADVIAVQPGSEDSGFAEQATAILSDSITLDDIEAVRRKENVPHALDVAPFVVVPGSVSYENETYRPQIVGGSAEFYQEVFNAYPREGEMFGESAIDEKASVAVIGHKVHNELFGQESGLGKKITIMDRKFRVVGILPKLGQVAFAQFDTVVIIPYSTAQTYVLGQTHFNEFIVRVDDPDNVAITEQDIERTMRESHDLEPGEENDFVIRTPEALVEQVGSILTSLTIFLGSVVGIALLVGGIGIMNIMLVSVTERTKEIGLRKAVGAKNGDILMQFLLEAMLLTFLGGLVGVVMGGAFAFGAAQLILTFTSLEWTFTFPWAVALGTLVFSAAIGLVFGLYPARKASKKSPMEALRYE